MISPSGFRLNRNGNTVKSRAPIRQGPDLSPPANIELNRPQRKEEKYWRTVLPSPLNWSRRILWLIILKAAERSWWIRMAVLSKSPWAHQKSLVSAINAISLLYYNQIWILTEKNPDSVPEASADVSWSPSPQPSPNRNWMKIVSNCWIQQRPLKNDKNYKHLL